MKKVINRDAVRTILTLLLMTVVSAGAAAQYSLSMYSGKVEILRGTKTEMPQKGMKLGAADQIVIGHGGKVQILDSRDNKLYERDEPGKIGVTSLIFEAQKSAYSNAKSVHRKISLGKPSEEEGKMYVEKGKITMALEEYDPAGEEFMIDAKVMARYIMSALNGGIDRLPDFPVELKHERNDEGALMFSIDNTASEPLYINVIKLRDDGNGDRRLRISELGQPVGCYVLLPDQSIVRSQHKGVSDKDLQLLVATHYYFSIDELITELEQVMAANEAEPGAMLSLPIYLQKIQ